RNVRRQSRSVDSSRQSIYIAVNQPIFLTYPAMDPRIPPTQALRALEAVARTGSLTKAAEAMHVTHGAISHQLKGLEDDLGVRLIERAGRGIRLTDEGERFAGRVRAALTDIAEAVREITEHNNPRQFRVSVMPS